MVAISASLDPDGSNQVFILTHSYETAACAFGVVTVTAGVDRSRYRYHGN